MTHTMGTNYQLRLRGPLSVWRAIARELSAVSRLGDPLHIFLSFGLGPSGIKKETSEQSSFSDFEAGSYESLGAPSMSLNEFEWHLSVFGGLGLSVKVYRILQLVAQGEYLYVPGLENNGGVHNHGGWSITNQRR